MQMQNEKNKIDPGMWLLSGLCSLFSASVKEKKEATIVICFLRQNS